MNDDLSGDAEAFLASDDSEGDSDDSFDGFLEEQKRQKKEQQNETSEDDSEESDMDSDSSENSNSPKSKKKPRKKRVSFAPGFVSGKSDVKSIAESEIKERDTSTLDARLSAIDGNNADKRQAAIEQTKALYPYDPAVSLQNADETSDLKKLVQSSSDSSLSSSMTQSGNNKNKDNKKGDLIDERTLAMTEWMAMQGGAYGMSGSETSDTEMDFAKINDRYSEWNTFNASNQRKRQSMAEKQALLEQKASKLEQKLDELKEEMDEVVGDDEEQKNEVHSKIEREFMAEKLRRFREKQKKKGVIYISSLPFGTTPSQLKKIFSEFGDVTNVHLEARKNTKGEKQKIYGKWADYTEAWIEMADKQTAKMVARLLHGTKIPKKYVNNRHARGHEWDLQYLKGFRWHRLLEHKEQLRVAQRRKFERSIAEAHRQAAYYKEQIARAQRLSEQGLVPELRHSRHLRRNQKKRKRSEMENLVKFGGDADTSEQIENAEANLKGIFEDSSDEDSGLMDVREPPKKKRIPQRKSFSHIVKHRGNESGEKGRGRRSGKKLGRLSDLSKSMFKK